MLPPDNHVHSQWSWDADAGAMAETCARALALGLPAVAFTEHVDQARWLITPPLAAGMQPGSAILRHIGSDNRFNPPPLDVASYRECLQDCRARYPGLRIFSGVELGEPHWFSLECAALLREGAFERVLGSLHSLMIHGEAWSVYDLFGAAAPSGLTPRAAVRAYLTETLRLVESSFPFAVLAHIDYPVRRWPAAAGRCDATDFEDEYRAVLHALARSGRALELNTRLPLDASIVRWWREAGGAAISFGSDAHHAEAVGSGFLEAAAMAEAAGFRPGHDATDFWVRGAPTRP